VPRIKKAIVTDKVDIQSSTPLAEDSSLMTPVATVDSKDIVKDEQHPENPPKDIDSDIQVPLAKLPKDKFKQLHIKDTFWLENDIYQTIADITEGKKSAKALLINEALKDYLQKNNREIKPLRVKVKKA